MMTKIPKTPIRKQKTLSRPDIFDKFAKWMALPRSLRQPPFQKDFATDFEISPDTLSDYKKLKYFWDLVEEKRKNLLSDIRDAELMKKIYEKRGEIETPPL